MNLVNKLFDIRSSADPEKAIITISEGVHIRGYNMWLLVCSAVLACIGLDTSSTAVIIGAMLISPLMSPILGIGLSFGVQDKTLLISSLKNFSAAVALSLITSVLYFLISPFAQPTPEIEARTYPTLLDVLIALFGGVAGIASATRSGSSTAIPGVAIATALMPPLCTAGYGLASGQWTYFGGAFYLFFINAVFISLATYWVVRFLKFPRTTYVSNRQKKYYVLIFLTVAIVITIPSIYFLYTVYRRQTIVNKLKKIILEPISAHGNEILKWEQLPKDSVIWVKVYHSGNPIKDSIKNSIAENLIKNDLGNYELKSVRVNMTKEEVNKLSAEVSRQMFQQLQIEKTAFESAKNNKDSIPVFQLERELRSAFPFVSTFTVGWYQVQGPSEKTDSVPAIFWKSNGPVSSRNQSLLKDFLKTRLGKDSVIVVKQ